MTRETHAPVRPPHLLCSITDGSRALGELSWFGGSAAWLATRPHRGDGRPVLVLPGFMAGDWSTVPLRRMLDHHGYRTHGWGLGRNQGPTADAIEGLDALFRRIQDQYARPISLIGQSLGGLFARELARRFPDSVDRIVTLGSPVSITDPAQSRAGHSYRRREHLHVPEFAFDRWTTAPQPAVPATSIFSRFDGIVRWQACLYPRTPLTENIEVASSHLGMAVQPPAVYATLDRLAAPLDPWRAFEPPRLIRGYFPGTADPTYLAA
ncbi:alpha/beta hydrolase [Tsukamurella sp. 8F]|uniref:esterase/lipase family protein n=1 Tax=unclassified Tsukamurella TaxID=2633480 RepID=UPI0023B9CB8B|nr:MULTISPECIES: alpha/beta hydrolase [unclassified Tsukamurella]MDF0529343.1 alpha/beta hydrolase [Tsukamurella sp. 8J]MDF0587150.1 alpha/beta hydrolase [Tsukamurella sp. 8F]